MAYWSGVKVAAGLARMRAPPVASASRLVPVLSPVLMWDSASMHCFKRAVWRFWLKSAPLESLRLLEESAFTPGYGMHM